MPAARTILHLGRCAAGVPLGVVESHGTRPDLASRRSEHGFHRGGGASGPGVPVIDGPDPVTISGLAASYTATVGEAVSFEFTFAPSAAVPSQPSVTPAELVLALTHDSGTATVTGTATHADTYTATFEFTHRARTDTHTATTTITVACRAGRTQQPDRTCAAPVCAAPLGSIATGTLGPQSGTWERDCVLPTGRRSGSGTYYAKHYTFTLTRRARVTIDLTSADQDAYLYLLSGHSPDGTELHHDDDSGTGSNSKLSVNLEAGDYTISASTYRTGRTGSFQVRVQASEPAVCTTTLDSGTINSQTLTLSLERGTWEDSCALPSGRRSGSGTYYAKHYTFTLTRSAQVTIDLTSDDQDTYLFLLSGHSPDGTELHRNDDSGTGRNSKLTDINLTAGDYTITATTYARQRTGSFSVRASAYLPLVVDGLEDSYDATVDEMFSAGFRYRAAVSEVSVAPGSGLSLALADLGGSAGLAGIPKFVDTYTVTLEFTQPGGVGEHAFTVAASCAEGHIQQSDRSCEPPVCTQPLGSGRISSGTLGGSGSWKAGCQLPANRRGGGPYYAMHYTFSLNLPAEVTIDLTSGDQDTYLILLEGHGPDGTVFRRDNDSGDLLNSRLSHMSLPAGDYTIIASTYWPERTGSFEVSIEAAASCPAGQVLIDDAACVQPLPRLADRHHSSLTYPPAGHLTDTCYRTDLSDGSALYTCRDLVDIRHFIDKSREDMELSEPHAMFGTIITLESGVILEGCQSVSAEYWQCDYRADFVWHQRVVGLSATNYTYPALVDGVLRPLECAVALAEMWFARDPGTLTSVVDACLALLEEDE